MDTIDQQYQALVERIGRYTMPEAARAAILAEIEAFYRRERAELDRRAGLRPRRSPPTA
jgi:hypothetical protein